MKKTILLFLLSAFFLISYAQVKKVAILPTVDQVGNVGYGVLFQVRTSLTYAISNTPGYEGYDRVDLAAIMGEHDFQRTGNVSEDQIKALGKMTGAAYVLIAEAVVYDEQHIMIAAKILDVETGGVKNSSTPEYASKAPSEMAEACRRICETLFNIEGSRELNADGFKFYTKRDLIKAGFRFYTPSKELYPIEGVDGASSLENFGFNIHNYENSYYIEGKNINGKLNGIVCFYDAYEKEYVLSYAVDGCIAYPVVGIYGKANCPRICIEEGSCSYCYMVYCSWDKPSDRPLFEELMKVYGDFIADDTFGAAVLSEDIKDYLYSLNYNFTKFMNSGKSISPETWSCPEDW